MHISSAAISCILRLSHDMSERPERKGQVPPGGEGLPTLEPRSPITQPWCRAGGRPQNSKTGLKREVSPLKETSNSSCTTASRQLKQSTATSWLSLIAQQELEQRSR